MIALFLVLETISTKNVLFGSFIINDDLYFFPFFLAGGSHIFEKEEEGRKKRGIIYKGEG